jgi:hypothetical protein
VIKKTQLKFNGSELPRWKKHFRLDEGFSSERSADQTQRPEESRLSSG